MRRLISILAALVVGLLLGFLAGLYIANEAAPAPEASPGAKTPTLTPLANGTATTPLPPVCQTATNEPESVDADTPATAATEPHTPATSAAIMRPMPKNDDTVRIPRKFMSKIHCAVFNTSSNCVAGITDDIVELLGISPEERARLDNLIVTTRAKIEEHELDRAVVTEQSPTRVVLKIAANADAGRDLETAFASGVQETLGDRATAFLDRANPFESMLFNCFGKSDTVLTVTRDEKSSLLRVKSEQDYGGPNGGHYTSSTTTMSPQMPERWKKFFQAP